MNKFAGIDHDGATYEPKRDRVRLNEQQQRVFNAVKSGKWFTLRSIHNMTNDPEASISARLRDFRKEKFGAHQVDREYMADGLWKYRLIVNEG